MELVCARFFVSGRDAEARVWAMRGLGLSRVASIVSQMHGLVPKREATR